VSYLQYYINYRAQGKYNLVDVYGKTPFKLHVDDSLPQLYNKQITVKDLGEGRFELSTSFESGQARLYNYSTYKSERIPIKNSEFKKIYALGDSIRLPFLNGVLEPTSVAPRKGRSYSVSLGNFNGTVRRFQGVRVIQNPRGSSILELSYSATNKNIIVDYLNASVKVREQDQLERKNLFATNTIKFIDSTLVDRNEELGEVLDELNDFQSKNIGITLKGGAATVTAKLQQLDNEKEVITKTLSDYDNLEAYLNDRTDYSNVQAPSIIGIEEPNITRGIGNIIDLSIQRNNSAQFVKEGNEALKDLDRRINAEKAVLKENISSSKERLNREIRQVNAKIREGEAELFKFPKEEQELANIQRRLSLSQQAYNLFQSKRSEATIIKASNVSDILFIDTAKDVGGGQVGPNTRLNYIVAAVMGGAVPLGLVFLLVFFNTKIGNPEEIKKMSNIPILGIVGKSHHKSNLLLRDHPRSSISESFRGLRSSLQFMYRKQEVEGAKTVLVTSSVSGEGKTFTSINLATVFALSEKKTVLVGLDLRKPKIFDDFKLSNDIGVVNYLIGDKTINEIRQASSVPFLDIILAGPIPPNPSELLMSDPMKTFMTELKAHYDYIILDTPPVGLVADALEVMNYADASLYMVRQGYTKKGMLGLINDKHAKGEVKNISFVLNYFRTKGKYGYNYGYGYGYGYGAYGNGYHQDGKKPNIFVRWRRKLKRSFRKH